MRWTLGRLALIKEAAKALEPHLVVKRDIANVFLGALEIFPETRKRHWIGERSWDKKMSIEVARIALTLNPASSRKTFKKINYLEKIEKIFDEDPRFA